MEAPAVVDTTNPWLVGNTSTTVVHRFLVESPVRRANDEHQKLVPFAPFVRSFFPCSFREARSLGFSFLQIVDLRLSGF